MGMTTLITTSLELVSMKKAYAFYVQRFIWDASGLFWKTPLKDMLGTYPETEKSPLKDMLGTY